MSWGILIKLNKWKCMSIIEFWQSSKSGHLVKRENDQIIVFLLENLYWEAFQNKFEVKNIPTSICNFGEKQNCFNIYNKCLSLITKVIINKCNSDSKTNICNNYYSTSSDSVCLWKKKESIGSKRNKTIELLLRNRTQSH